MILTITIVVGALVGATAVAGSMMVRQIRQSTQSIDSTRAIFAAETGIEAALYKQFKNSDYTIPTLPLGKSKAEFKVVVTKDSGGLKIKSVGKSKTSVRALEVRIAEIE